MKVAIFMLFLTDRVCNAPKCAIAWSVQYYEVCTSSMQYELADMNKKLVD